MTLRGMLAIAVLAALAAGAWWLSSGHETTPGGAQTESGPRPDYYFRDATVTRYDAAGKPKTRLQAAEIDHYPGPALTRFSRITLHGGEGAKAWSVTAQHARAGDDRKVMHLSGDVSLTSGTGAAPLHVETDHLTLYTDRDFAQTDAPVRVSQGASQVNGSGLSVWLDQKRFALESKVKGHYVLE